MSAHIVTITIEATKTPVSRTLVIPDRLSFMDLHRIIQIAFGWEDIYTHAFSFPSSSLKIVPIDEYQDEAADLLCENQVDLDYSLRTNLYIIYTYGSVKHKITYEKENTSFENNYPVITSFTGDNYADGQKGKPEKTIPFVLNETNSRLRDYRLFKGSDVHQKLPVIIEKEAENDVNEQMNTLFEFLQKWQEEEMTSMNGSKASLLTDLTVEHTDLTYRDMLMQYAEHDLDRMCRFLDLNTAADASTEEKADQISQTMHDNPELFLYLFSDEDLKWLLDMLKAEDGDWLMLFSANYIAFPLMYGIITFEIKKTKKQWLGIIHPASDFETMLQSISPQVKKHTRKMIEKREKQVMAILNQYGVIELEQLKKIMHEQFDVNTDDHELIRVIRMHLALPNRIYSGASLDGHNYVSLFKEEEEVITILRASWASQENMNLTYRPCTRKELNLIMYGPVYAFSSWKDIRGRLMRDGMNRKDADQLTDYLYKSVLSGSVFEDLMNCLEKNTISNNDMDRIRVWYLALDAYLDTPQAAAWGWSYRELVEKYAVPFKEVLSVDKKKTAVRTPVNQLPAVLQEKAYLCIKNNDQMLASELKQEKYKDLQVIADSVRMRS